ncbi:MAG TPA: hypothetical protein VFY93_16895 [Planctomycetota bacterium]|nr:hypothetical protein [Planctomycetota bacterium]
MTTWHEREQLRDVVDFLADCTAIEGRPPEWFAVLLGGGPEQIERTVRAAVEERFAIRSA